MHKISDGAGSGCTEPPPSKCHVKKRQSTAQTARERIRAIKLGRKPKGMPHSVAIAKISADAKTKVMQRTLERFQGNSFVLRFVVNSREFRAYEARVTENTARLHERLFGDVALEALRFYEMDYTPGTEENDEGSEENWGGNTFPRSGSQLRRFYATVETIKREQFGRIKGHVQLLVHQVGEGLNTLGHILSGKLMYESLVELVRNDTAFQRGAQEALHRFLHTFYTRACQMIGSKPWNESFNIQATRPEKVGKSRKKRNGHKI